MSCRPSLMLVDPLTPRVEVLGSALISDRLERSGRNRFFFDAIGTVTIRTSSVFDGLYRIFR